MSENEPKPFPKIDTAIIVALDYYIKNGYIDLSKLPNVLDCDFSMLLKELKEDIQKNREWHWGFAAWLREQIKSAESIDKLNMGNYSHGLKDAYKKVLERLKDD